MAHPILSEDWSDYDNRKIKDKRDGRFVSCEESWEVEYLLGKIRKYARKKTDVEIKAAIASCCKTVPGSQRGHVYGMRDGKTLIKCPI